MFDLLLLQTVLLCLGWVST